MYWSYLGHTNFGILFKHIGIEYCIDIVETIGDTLGGLIVMEMLVEEEDAEYVPQRICMVWRLARRMIISKEPLLRKKEVVIDLERVLLMEKISWRQK